MDKKITDYLKERDEALIAGGDQYAKFCEKHHDGRMPDPRVVEMSLHKARIHWRGCPPELLKESVWWLLDRGLHLDIHLDI